MPSELLQQIPVLVAIMLVASAIQGATGFGFGLFAVAALSLLVPLKTATPMLAVLNAPVIFYLLWKLRGHVVWRGLGPMIAAVVVGIPFGVFVLVHWPQEVLLRILGVVLVFAAVRSLIGANGEDRDLTPRRTVAGSGLEVLTGLAAGALSGAFNTGGPPAIAYVYCQPWTKERRSATLQAIFAISIVVRILTMAVAGLYHAPLLIASAACLPGALLGMRVGYAVFRRIPPRALEIVVAIFLAGIAVKLLIWA